MTWKEGFEYKYAMFEQLPDINVDSNKHNPALSVDLSIIDVTVMKEENNKKHLAVTQLQRTDWLTIYQNFLFYYV